MFIVIGDRCGTWILSFVIKLWGSFGCYSDKIALFEMGFFVFCVVETLGLLSLLSVKPHYYRQVADRHDHLCWELESPSELINY